LKEHRRGGFEGFAEWVAVVERNLAMVWDLRGQIVANALISLDKVSYLQTKWM